MRTGTPLPPCIDEQEILALADDNPRQAFQLVLNMFNTFLPAITELQTIVNGRLGKDNLALDNWLRGDPWIKVEPNQQNPQQAMRVRHARPHAGLDAVGGVGKHVQSLQIDGRGHVESWAEADNAAEELPVGAVIAWADLDGNGAPQNIPTGWNLCDGSNGTIDLRGRFIVAYNPSDADYDNATNTGGTATNTHDPHATHDHTGVTGYAGAHVHEYDSATEYEAGIVVASGTGTTVAANGHTHFNSSDSEGLHQNSISEQAAMSHSSVDNRPPWHVLVFIQKIA